VSRRGRKPRDATLRLSIRGKAACRRHVEGGASQVRGDPTEQIRQGIDAIHAGLRNCKRNGRTMMTCNGPRTALSLRRRARMADRPPAAARPRNGEYNLRAFVIKAAEAHERAEAELSEVCSGPGAGGQGPARAAAEATGQPPQPATSSGRSVDDDRALREEATTGAGSDAGFRSSR